MTELTMKDFKSDQEVRWCPGCGDYAILAAVQSFMPELGLEREKIVFISGIGCAARFPYYMQTYGMHSIHGRAPAIATGLAVSRPDLSVWVVTGDGDSLSIGGNHLIHALRRNVNVKILMFNNQIYGLTKGQYSPTSEQGKVTGSTPMGSVDYPFNPLSLALGAEATFVARALDTDKPGLTNVLRRAAAHKGAAFVEIFQNCNIYNDGAFDFVRDTKENRLYLEHGQPAGDTGITHDETDFATAFALSRVTYATHGVVPLGVFRDVERESYDSARAGPARQRERRRRPRGARHLGRHLVDRLDTAGSQLWAPSSTRSTSARSRTRTATGSAISPALPAGSTTSTGSGSKRSGSARRSRARTSTGATTSPTTTTSIPTTGPSPTSTR